MLAAAAPVAAQEKLTVWWAKGFYKSEDDALYEAIKKYEAKTGVKIELSQYAAPGDDSEDGRGARRRHAARCRLCRRLRLPGRGQVGVRRQARGHHRNHRADQGQVPQGHRRDDLPLQRQDQEEGVLRVSAEAADDAHPVLEEHAGGRRLQGVRYPDHLEGLLGLLVRQGAAGPSQQDRQAHLRGRPSDGRRFERRVLLVPDLRRRVQREDGRRQRQAAGRRSEGQGRAGRDA